MNRHVFPLSVAVAAIAAAGCGSKDDSTKSAADAPATTVADPQPLGPEDIPKHTSTPKGSYNGHYTGVLTRAQAIKFGGPQFTGTVTLALRPGGTYRMTFSQGSVRGRYSAAPGHRLVFGSDEICDREETKGKGLYGWTLSGTTLRVTALVAETGGCTGRSKLLTLPTWHKD